MNTPEAFTRQAMIHLVELVDHSWGVRFVFEDGEITWAVQVFPTRAEAAQAVEMWLEATGGESHTVH